MKNNLLNEGYGFQTTFYDKGLGTYIFKNGKKYIDLCCGGGSLLMGYNHSQFLKTLKNIPEIKIANFSAPNKHAANLSLTIKKILPQFDKFILCNSGAEANTKALRICRAVTKKNKIILISGSWHGSVDQLLFKQDKHNKIIELSAGLEKNLKKNLIIIPYNNYKISKKILDENIDKICCVMVEPIQGGLPEAKSLNYLKKINSYCLKNDIIFLLDEIISGLRFNSGSFQKLADLNSDISTFGKGFGSGMPIGFIGLSKKVYDKISREKINIIFGGTFSGNSITSHVSNEFLKYFIKNSRKIIANINAKTINFSYELNLFFKQNKLEIQVYYFQSLARIIFTKEQVINRTQRDFLEKNQSTNIIKMTKELEKVGIKYPSNGVLLFNNAMNNEDIKYLIINFKKVILKIFR